MRRQILILLVFAGLSGFYFYPSAPRNPTQAAFSPASTTIYFNDSGSDLLILGNSIWEVAFLKTNGGIAYIRDKAYATVISTGSRYECLWGASDMLDQFYMGGCSFHKDWDNRFSYSWSGADHRLTLSYVTDPLNTDSFNATVQVTASEMDYFDMQLEVQEHYSDGRLFDYLLFPSDLYFSEADVKGVLLPQLPGVVLKPGFFAENRIYYWNYPGYPGAFADYMAISTTKGELAIYSIHDNFLQPVQSGINNDDDYQPASYYISHNFGVMLEPYQLWKSPLVRLRVSKNWSQSILSYRQDNGLDKYPSLSQKLGSLYNPLIHMPEYRLVSFEVGAKFSQYDSLFFSQLRTPSLLHPVGYQPIGHDHYSPDYLPPDTRWCNIPANCTQEFAAMFNQAKARGWLVMPYTNPTWWNPDGPTLQNLPAPLTLEDISVLDRAGAPLYEMYGPNPGYVVSPYVPFVQGRVEQLMDEMTSLVPGDLVFEDQIAARVWMFDFNPASPTTYHYIQGWLEHTRTYQDKLLTTELAFDRLAETEVGFYGSILLPQKLGQTAGWWGDQNWSLYPLAQMMSRDKTLFYQHDLDLNTFSDNKPNITWNLAMGYNLGDDLRLTEGSVHDNPWLKLNGELQDHLLADYASERVTGFNNLAPNVSQTVFQSINVIANWDSANAYTVDGCTLSPSGALVRDAYGQLTAGILTAFNGHPLSSGDHYLIVKVNMNQISVRQPMGASTSLTLPLPPGWQSGDDLQANALNITGENLGSLPLTVTNQGITFTYPLTSAGQEVEQVIIVDPDMSVLRIYLPLLRK